MNGLSSVLVRCIVANTCPYCRRGSPTFYEDPPGDFHVACQNCCRGPKDPIEEDDIANGRALEVWDKWCRRIRAKKRKRKEEM